MPLRDIATYAGLLGEPQVRGALAAIKAAEGTTEEKRANSYTTGFGFTSLPNLDQHPGTSLARSFTDRRGRRNVSTAAGGYQFLSRTWKDISGKLGLKDFSPLNQDIAALALIDQEGALDDVLAGDVRSFARKTRDVWASIPGANYDQPTVKLSVLEKAWNKAAGVRPNQPSTPVDRAALPNLPPSVGPVPREAARVGGLLAPVAPMPAPTVTATARAPMAQGAAGASLSVPALGASLMSAAAKASAPAAPATLGANLSPQKSGVKIGGLATGGAGLSGFGAGALAATPNAVAARTPTPPAATRMSPATEANVASRIDAGGLNAAPTPKGNIAPALGMASAPTTARTGLGLLGITPAAAAEMPAATRPAAPAARPSFRAPAAAPAVGIPATPAAPVARTPTPSFRAAEDASMAALARDPGLGMTPEKALAADVAEQRARTAATRRAANEAAARAAPVAAAPVADPSLPALDAPVTVERNPTPRAYAPAATERRQSVPGRVGTERQITSTGVGLPNRPAPPTQPSLFADGGWADRNKGALIGGLLGTAAGGPVGGLLGGFLGNAIQNARMGTPSAAAQAAMEAGWDGFSNMTQSQIRAADAARAGTMAGRGATTSGGGGGGFLGGLGSFFSSVFGPPTGSNASGYNGGVSANLGSGSRSSSSSSGGKKSSSSSSGGKKK